MTTTQTILPQVEELPVKNGIVFYDSVYYGADDRATFAKRVDAIIAQRKDVGLIKSDEVCYGNRNGELYYEIGKDTVCASKENVPKYCMFRSNNWRFAEHLENMGIKVFPSSAVIRFCADKMLAHSGLCNVVKMPDTVYELGFNDFVSDKKNYPVIVKASEGTCGREVQKADNFHELIRSIDKIGTNKWLIYQRPCPTGTDLRVYTLDSKIILCILREPAEGEFKANLANGATASLYELSDEQKEVVNAVYDELDRRGETGFICCDFLFDADGNLVFNELNAAAGIQRLTELTDYDVVKVYFDIIEKKVGIERKEEKPEWVPDDSE